MFSQKSTEFFLITMKVLWIHWAHTVDAPSKALYLFFIGTDFFTIDKKIILYYIPIEMTIIIHGHRLCATTIQTCDKDKHSLWPIKRHFNSPFRYIKLQFSNSIWNYLMIANNKNKVYAHKTIPTYNQSSKKKTTFLI